MAARLRDRDAEFHSGAIDLNALTAKVVSDQSMFAHACGVMVTATLPDRPVLIDGDPAAFELALANLVDNAIRYNRDGGTVTVDLDGGTPRGAFVLTIADDGPGVNDASLKYFNGIRRFRGDERRRHREDEVGLGLAIVHEVTGRARVALGFRRRDNGGLEVTLKSVAGAGER
jgi:signal transduction histidine kinase